MRYCVPRLAWSKSWRVKEAREAEEEGWAVVEPHQESPKVLLPCHCVRGQEADNSHTAHDSVLANTCSIKLL